MRHPNRNPVRLASRWIALIVALVLLTACSLIEFPNARATISGTLSYGPTFAGAAAEGARVGVASGGETFFELSTAGRDADFVPGEIIVKFRDAEDGQQMVPQATLHAAGITLPRARTLALPRTALYRAAVDRASTLAVIDALNARPDVAYAHPNYVLESFLQPSDEFYSYMWHYPFVDLEGAWDITTGSSSTVVAVLDTGMLFGHPDAPVNLVGGYDFVSKDSDPTDPGPNDQTGYHGTHVTGTVAAAANNDYRGGMGADGIAGVSWTTSVLPVRVLDGSGGTVADISDAIIWSSGGFVPDVPDNAFPADVINLSLGGPSPCTNAPMMQEAIDFAASMGSIVVAAAGNGGDDQIGDDAANTMPASCTSVFTVGAWTLDDDRANYSNWGSVVDLMAPGGDLSRDVNGDSEPDGVLSLGYVDGSLEPYTYVWSTGTSMATPHVSGVIALMLAADPGLTRQELRQILMFTANPYTSSQCSAGQSISSASTACGAGILDAHAAVGTALGPSGPVRLEAWLTTTMEPSGGNSTAGLIVDYSISVMPGSNYIYAWSDEDGDGQITAGDWFGAYPFDVVLDAGESVTGLDFTLSYVTSAEQVATELPEGLTLDDIEQAR